VLTTQPSLARLLLTAGRDLYEHTSRLIPANLLWGTAAVAWVSLLLLWPPVLVVVLAPLLLLPVVAVFRLAACITRGRDVRLSGAFRFTRTFVAPALLTGTVISLGVVASVTYVAFGIGFGGLIGAGIATVGGWGMVATALVALTFLPLLADPDREAQPLRTKLRLAGLVILTAPAKSAGFGVVVAVILVASTIAFPALLTVSIAYSACVAVRVVLPLADRLDAPLAERGYSDRG
jgi:hypothetical protein